MAVIGRVSGVFGRRRVYVGVCVHVRTIAVVNETAVAVTLFEIGAVHVILAPVRRNAEKEARPYAQHKNYQKKEPKARVSVGTTTRRVRRRRHTRRGNGHKH